MHVSLGTEAAAQLKLDRFNKETTIAQNKRAIQLLRKDGIVVEAQFIVGLENETRETLEETYQMAQDWKPDLANWSMYTPWPFSDLFQELGDKVEVFDYEKYNFVTPIMKPDGDGPRRAARPGDEQLPPLLHEEGAVLLPLGRHRRAPALPARLPQGVPEGRLRAQVLRPRQGQLLGPAVEEEGRLPLRRARASAPTMGKVEWQTTHNRKLKGQQQAEIMACGGGKEQMREERQAVEPAE